jgi:ABC-2 type transport system permease protein
MAGYGLLLRKELLEQWRTRRLPVVVIVFTLLGLVSPVVARYMREILEAAGGTEFQGLLPEPVARHAVNQLTRNLGQFGVLITILVTMGAVAGEKDRGTAVFVLTKPLGRGAFLGAKLTAIALLLAAATALAGAGCWVYTTILFEPLPLAGYVPAIGLLWLSLLVFAAITFAASVMAPSAMVAGGLGLAALLGSGFLAVVPNLAPYLPTGLWGLAEQLAVGETPDPLVLPVILNVAVVGIMVAASWWSFRGQEL